MSKYLELLPAVDVADGKAVRLTQGEAGSETDYGDPVEAAMAFWMQTLNGPLKGREDADSGLGTSAGMAGCVGQRHDLVLNCSDVLNVLNVRPWLFGTNFVP